MSVYPLLAVNGPLPVEESVDVTVNEKLPKTVGVPLSTPSPERLSPAGSAPPVIA